MRFVFRCALALALLTSPALAASTVGTVGLTLGSAFTDPGTKEANITWVHVTGYTWNDTTNVVQYTACGYLSQSAASSGATPIYCANGSLAASASDQLAAIYSQIITALAANTPSQVGSP